MSVCPLFSGSDFSVGALVSPWSSLLLSLSALWDLLSFLSDALWFLMNRRVLEARKRPTSHLLRLSLKDGKTQHLLNFERAGQSGAEIEKELLYVLILGNVLQSCYFSSGFEKSIDQQWIFFPSIFLKETPALSITEVAALFFASLPHQRSLYKLMSTVSWWIEGKCVHSSTESVWRGFQVGRYVTSVLP